MLSVRVKTVGVALELAGFRRFRWPVPKCPEQCGIFSKKIFYYITYNENIIICNSAKCVPEGMLLIACAS